MDIVTLIPFVDTIYCPAYLGELVVHLQSTETHGHIREININYNRHELQCLVRDKYSDCDTVLLMDSDVIATKEQLDALQTAFDGTPLALKTKPFNTNNHICCACCMMQMEDYIQIKYIDEYVGVRPWNYVNSGVLLLNMRRLREVNFSQCFLSWVEHYGLETVAPDQDYLNALCRDRIHYLDPDWNAMPSECLCALDSPHIIHFNLASKPWLNEQVPYGDVFWHYAEGTGYEEEIRARRQAFLQDSAAVKQYKSAIGRLIRMACRLARSEHSFRSVMETRQALRPCS